jgi:hypothetical protein
MSASQPPKGIVRQSEMSVLYRTAEATDATPASITAMLDAILGDERAATTTAEASLADAWADVEAIIEKNKARDAALAALRGATGEFSDVPFWTPETLQEHFGLTPATEYSVPPELAEEPTAFGVAAVEAIAAAVVDELADSADSGGKKARKKKAVQGTAPSRAAMKAAADSAAPISATHAPIRRCYAPIVRARDATPPEFTLLINSLEATQKRVKGIEVEMQERQFALPLHAPFMYIARHIQRCLIPQPTGLTMERWFAAEVQPRLAQTAADYEALAAERDGNTIIRTLTAEIAQREQVNGACVDLMHATVKVGREMKDVYEAAQAKVVAQCEDALEVVTRRAMSVTEGSRALVEELAAVEVQGAGAFAETEQAAAGTFRALEFRLKRSREKQEKATRKIREHSMELRKEQAEHERTVSEYLEAMTQFKRTEAAHLQFAQACADRKAMLADAHRTCVFVQTIIAAVTDEVRIGLDQCRLHISRVVSEEDFRKKRVAAKPMSNVLQWYRALGDLRHIRRERLAEVEGRMAGSWQLGFLLSGERQAHADAVDDCNAQMAAIQALWARLSQQLVSLEVAPPVLFQLDKDPAVMAMRARFMAVEGIGKERNMREVRKQIEGQPADAVVLPPVPPPRTSKAGMQRRPLGRPPSPPRDEDPPRDEEPPPPHTI